MPKLDNCEPAILVVAGTLVKTSLEAAAPLTAKVAPVTERELVEVATRA